MVGKRKGPFSGGFGGGHPPVHAVMTRALWKRDPNMHGFDVAIRENMIRNHEKALRTPPPGTPSTRKPKR